MSGFNKDPADARRELIRRSSLIGIFVALILFGLGLQGRQAVGGQIPAASEDFSAHALAVLSLPLNGVEKMVLDARSFFGLRQENLRLKAELDNYTQIERQGQILREQVDYLEGIIGLEFDVDYRQGQITARAVSENDGPFVKSALINAGANRGVSKGQAVMTVDGLYGRVVRHGQNSARVLLLTDLSSRIPVMSLRSRSRAIMTGQNSSIPELDFRGNSDWVIGDRVITSGDDGELPRGLPIGDVVQLNNQQYGVSLYADRNPVDWVQIVPFRPIVKPENDPVTSLDDASGVDLAGLEEQSEASVENNTGAENYLDDSVLSLDDGNSAEKTDTLGRVNLNAQ